MLKLMDFETKPMRNSTKKGFEPFAFRLMTLGGIAGFYCLYFVIIMLVNFLAVSGNEDHIGVSEIVCFSHMHSTNFVSFLTIADYVCRSGRNVSCCAVLRGGLLLSQTGPLCESQSNQHDAGNQENSFRRLLHHSASGNLSIAFN